MAGCYGNDPEDRYFEKKLNDYLDSEAPIDCDECETSGEIYLDDETFTVCPACNGKGVLFNNQ